MAIKFGTDGWRGIIADDFTFSNVAACAQALSDYLKEHGGHGKPLIIGYDTRFASESFASVCAEVAAANGIKVLLSSRALPTPVTSYAVVSNGGAGAIMITASHNPPQWNGLKVKSEKGSSAEPKVTSELEQRIAEVIRTNSVRRMPIAQAQKSGYVNLVDMERPYLDHIAGLVDMAGLKRAHLNVIVDSMYGSGSGYLRGLLAGGTIQITEIHGDRNPAFPGMQQPEPIAHNLVELIASVKEKGYNVGLATDGDADRLGVVDQTGEFLTQLQVFALLSLYLLEVRGERGPLVKTTTTTSMIFRLADLYGVEAFETPVGFKYVAPVMMANNALIGGEESGGYGFLGHIPERDGILAALYFLDFMVKTGKTPSELVDHLYSKVGPHYYDRIDVEFDPSDRQRITSVFTSASPDRIMGKGVVKIDRSEGARFIFSDGSWLFMRLSGTEPIMRIYAESPAKAESAALLQAGKKIAGV
ncbi:MAG: phosphoglucomutase/phosphomannomutase family protein [Dehalococcoidia bacterium]|nr:phosphoglucomutase/phosphomannomutase family protein [Dehalococcoidia bacterium]